MNIQTPLKTLGGSETWLEVWPFDPVSRAVRFIDFLHESASASDVELEPVEGARYRFRVSSSPSTVVEALLSTTEFFPESIHSSVSGPLEVRLTASGKGAETIQPASTREASQARTALSRIPRERRRSAWRLLAGSSLRAA
jgi:hypothetical protein